jgi:hypothetical protein
LPFSYKFTVSLSLIAVFILVIQRFLYDNGYKKDKPLFWLFFFNSVAAIFLLPCAICHTCLVGNITGWAQVFIWTIYQLPQVFKIQIDKSVFGFSFAMITLFFLGELAELIIAIKLNFPVQTFANSFRGIATYAIFCTQFFLYSREIIC